MKIEKLICNYLLLSLMFTLAQVFIWFDVLSFAGLVSNEGRIIGARCADDYRPINATSLYNVEIWINHRLAYAWNFYCAHVFQRALDAIIS